MAQMQLSHSGLHTSQALNAIQSTCKTNYCCKYAELIKLQSSRFQPVLLPTRSLEHNFLQPVLLTGLNY